MKVDILGKKVTIKRTARKTMSKEFGYPVDGYFCPSKYEIHIAKDMEKEKFKQTLLHELIHVCMNRVGADQVISPELQEILCESIANSLAAFVSLETSKSPGKKDKDQLLL